MEEIRTSTEKEIMKYMDIELLHNTHIIERVTGKLTAGEVYHTLVF